MIIKLNSRFDRFIETARRLYQESKKPESKQREYEFPDYTGMKTLGRDFSSSLVHSLQNAYDLLRHGAWEGISEKSFIEGCLSESFMGNFYDEFLCKGQKLY